MSPQPVVPTAHRPRRSPRPSQACPCQRTRRPPPLLLILFPFLASLFAVVASPTTFPWSLPFLVSLSKPFALPLPTFARSLIPFTANLTPFVVSRIPFVLKLIPFVRGLVEPRRPPSSPQPHGHPTTNLRAISGEPAPNTPRGQHPDFGPQRTPKPAKSDPRAAEEFFRKNSYSARMSPASSPIRPTSPRPACPQPVPAPGEPVEPQPPHPKRRRISHPPARNTPKGFRAGGCEYPQKATAITCANRQSARPSPHGTHPRH